MDLISCVVGPKCPKCKGKGYVPSTHLGFFSGKVVPNAFMDCECKQAERDYYHRIRPADMDFPCSDAFRGYSFEFCGKDDPAFTRNSEPEPAPY